MLFIVHTYIYGYGKLNIKLISILKSLLYFINFSSIFENMLYDIYMNVTNVTNNVAYMDLDSQW